MRVLHCVALIIMQVNLRWVVSVALKTKPVISFDIMNVTESYNEIIV